MSRSRAGADARTHRRRRRRRAPSTSRASQCSSAGTASCVVKTSTSPRDSPAARLRVAPWTNSARRDLVHRRAELARTLDAPVCSSRSRPRRPPRRRPPPVLAIASRQRVRSATAVLDRDEDGDHCGVAATTNWYARSEGRSSREGVSGPLDRRSADARDRRRDVERDDPVAGPLECLLERLLREEVRVRPVEDAAVGVPPPACEETRGASPSSPRSASSSTSLPPGRSKRPHPGRGTPRGRADARSTSPQSTTSKECCGNGSSIDSTSPTSTCSQTARASSAACSSLSMPTTVAPRSASRRAR